MASGKAQVALTQTNTIKNIIAATRNNNNTSTGPVTRSKTKAAAAFANRGVASNTNATKVSFDKSQSVSASASHEVKKEDGKKSVKVHSVYEDSLPTNLSMCPSRLASDANSSTGSRSGSYPTVPKGFVSPTHSNVSCSVPQVMTTGTTTLEKQLATMARVIEKLTKTVEEKDLQIAALMNKLEAQNVGEASQDNSNQERFTISHHKFHKQQIQIELQLQNMWLATRRTHS